MSGANKRAEVSIARFQTEQIIANAVGNDAEFLGRLLKLRSMDAHQFQLALKNTGRVDDEGRLLELMQRVEEECAGFVRRVGIVKLGQRAVELGVSHHESRGRVIWMAIFPEGRKHELRAMTTDGAGDESSVLGRVDQSAIG